MNGCDYREAVKACLPSYAHLMCCCARCTTSRTERCYAAHSREILAESSAWGLVCWLDEVKVGSRHEVEHIRDRDYALIVYRSQLWPNRFHRGQKLELHCSFRGWRWSTRSTELPRCSEFSQFPPKCHINSGADVESRSPSQASFPDPLSTIVCSRADVGKGRMMKEDVEFSLFLLSLEQLPISRRPTSTVTANKCPSRWGGSRLIHHRAEIDQSAEKGGLNCNYGIGR